MTSVSKLFLISAASGTGKSSLINSAINKIQKLGQKVELSISYTTRKERSDNQDYYKVSKVKHKHNLIINK